MPVTWQIAHSAIIITDAIGDFREVVDNVLSSPFFRVEFPCRSHQRFGLRLLVLWQSFDHVPQLVLATPLHQARCAERLGAGAVIAATAMVGRWARLAARVTVHSGVRVGIAARVGEAAVLGYGASVEFWSAAAAGARLGSHCEQMVPRTVE